MAASISSLSGSRYAAVLAEFQKGHSALDQVPADGKAALRSVFEAVEILFRLMFSRAPRLGGAEIREYLAPVVNSLNKGDPAAARSSQKFLGSLVEWVDAAHFYRHGQGTVEPTQPPLFYALAMVSSGASYLRWLGELDRLLQK
jgi:hypothetical protein